MENEIMETVSAIALNRIFGFEPAAAQTLIGEAGSASAVFELPAEELDRIFGPWGKHRNEITRSALDSAWAEWERLQERGCTFIHSRSDNYPKALLECADPPVGLYVRSSTPPEELFRSEYSVSVVGTRDISPYGKEMAERAVGAMSRAPVRPMIVSGLAIGVDITAHMAALSFGLPTVAVLPVGIDDVYPRRHSVAARKIAESPGSALVTDYPPGTQPNQFNFLRRNRIIAGLSGATLLVESKAKGGGTMTARLAASYGRELFCIPGRIGDIRSEGCNLLIQEKLAECISSIDSLPQALGLGKQTGRRRNPCVEVANFYGNRLLEQEVGELVSLADIIRRRRGITVEELAEESGLGYSRTAIWTGMLESDGFISVDLIQRCAINAKIL